MAGATVSGSLMLCIILSGADEWVEVFLQKEQRWICKYSYLYSETSSQNSDSSKYPLI